LLIFYLLQETAGDGKIGHNGSLLTRS